jgi:hypothetical protein
MNNDSKSENLSNQDDQRPETKPNEDAGIYYSSFLKITDPETGRVLVQTRAD